MAPNLFRYAPNELSQDAFLCWLLEWSDSQNALENPTMHDAGLCLLNALLRIHGRPSIQLAKLHIRKQLHHVDVVVELNDDLVLLIEDKVHSSEHEAQLLYLEQIAKHYPHRTILPIFFKTGDQCDYTTVEEAGYICFLRQHFLAAQDEGISLGVDHPIFIDFLTFLREREALKRTRPDFVWQYVPNPSGGFLGAWWHRTEWRGQRVYLQIEERQLCFKIHTFDSAIRSQLRDEWRNSVPLYASPPGRAGSSSVAGSPTRPAAFRFRPAPRRTRA
jgi:hypothetical protein